MSALERASRWRLPSLAVTVLLSMATAMVALGPAHAAPSASGSTHATRPDQVRAHGRAVVPEPTGPQPISTADANAGGANGQCPGGPYCSTRDGSPSMNGNGGGMAVGKPCAGCVGKADNKNPLGQMPDATDNNAGYECDTNHGIARSNPAHTACVPPTGSVCVPTPDNPCGEGGTPPPGGQLPPPGTQVPPGVVVPPSAGVVPPARHMTVVSPGVLPNTGAPASLGWIALLGAGSLFVGVALIRRRLLAGS